MMDIQWFNRKYSTEESGLAKDENGSLLLLRPWLRGLETASSDAAKTLFTGTLAISFLYFSVRSRLLWACAWRKACE